MGTPRSGAIDKQARSRKRLADIARSIAANHRSELEQWKKSSAELDRPDWLWESLLLSFSTMGRSKGAAGLMRNPELHGRVTYDALAKLSPRERRRTLKATLRAAKLVRMPDRKAEWLYRAFDRISTEMSGIVRAKELLLNLDGQDAKMQFLQTFDGIGPKYSRNMLMDVYHPDFRNSVAIDQRIQSISKALGLSFKNYNDHERFYLTVARDAGLNGWELDRLMYRFTKTFLDDLFLNEQDSAKKSAKSNNKRTTGDRLSKVTLPLGPGSGRLESQADEVAVDDEFGIYKPLFDGTGGYLTLLNLGEHSKSKRAISLIMKCSASVSNPYQDICRLLRQNNWRPHLVGSVAIAVLPQNAQAIDQLWGAVDRDSWVAPQLVAVAFLRDPRFADHAGDRLRFWSSSVGPSGKAPAALVRLIELLPKAPDSLTAAASAPTLVNLLKNDVDSSGTIAEEWLRSLRENLIDLGVSTSDGTLRK